MKNIESYSNSKKPEKENELKKFSIDFDEGHFGDSKRPMGTHELVGELNEWWEQSCRQNEIEPNDKRFKNASYYLIELAKNALEIADGGKIEVEISKDKITVVVTDQGPGFENPNDDILYGAPGHGLSEIKDFGDEFIIETNGKRFTKVKESQELIESSDTDIQQGARVTFIKNFDD